MSTPLNNTLSALSLSTSSPPIITQPHPPPITQPSNPPPPPTTLYPKIHKLSDLLYHIRPLLSPTTSTIHLTGTTKLHGTHADIVFSSPTTTSKNSGEGEIRAQSRNRTELLPGKQDNNGFAAFVAGIPQERLWALRRRIVRRWRELNPDREEGEVGAVIIAGEWCGAGIQKGVAINQLKRMFVVVSICVNGMWVDDRAYADVVGEEEEEVWIFHVAKGGWFECVVDLGDVRGSEREMEEVTERVVGVCPFAKKGFGVEGVGEGIVWKVRGWEGDARFWCKTKGERWAVSSSHKLGGEGGKGENLMGEFAKAVVLEGRLEQGWGELREEERKAKGFGGFLKWLEKDVLAEEGLEMERLGIGQAGLGQAIAGVAKPWFWRRVEEYKREGAEM